MKITITKTNQPFDYMLDVNWMHTSKLSESQARHMLATLFPQAYMIDIFREDGRTFDHDSGQSVGSALVWFE